MPKNPQALVGVEIQGGLGNQLFQYAAAYCLARQREAELRLNTHWFAHTDYRALALDRFGIEWTECWHPGARGALRAVARALGADKANPFRHAILRETRQAFMPELADAGLPVFLVGYFQSWRYFDSLRDDIKRLFDTARFSSARTARLESQIASTASPVMVHIRRGDYISNPETLARHGVVDRAYYERARQILADRGITGPYFIFSDDSDAARTMLGHWPSAYFVAGMTAFEDLRLMTLCRHAVIANSTFSWWGAWLGQNPESQVICPEAWVTPAYRDAQPINDLYPPDWIVV